MNEDKELLFPLTENDTCVKLYGIFSDIIFNIILKVVSTDFIINLEVDVDKEIENVNIEIKEISAEKLLEYKGIDYRIINGWNELSESEKYRIAENSSDVNMLTSILANLFK